MERNDRKKVLFVGPSQILARGLELIFRESGEFVLYGVLADFSPQSQVRLKNMSPDAVIVDPVVFDYASRKMARSHVSEVTDAAVILLDTVPIVDWPVKQFDDVIGIYDNGPSIIRKVRQAMAAHGAAPRSENRALSVREKEILACVAQGMLNKEIAYRYNLSIHTVITHRKNITAKTGIKTVAGLTVYALINNLIDPESLLHE